jgi:hypothetical protein
MAWKILKQFNSQSATVWVEKLSTEDTVYSYDTEAEALNKKTELEAADNSRLYKVVNS